MDEEEWRVGREEEIYIGGYIIRRTDEKHFVIENTMTGALRGVSEKRLEKLLDEFWRNG